LGSSRAWRPRRAFARFVPLTLGLVLLGYSSSIAYMLAIENSLVYAPTGPAEEWCEKPSADIQDVSLSTADGVMNAWYCPAEDPAGVILMCHGKAGNLSARAKYIPLLRDLFHCSILIFDYPGYGLSEGEPSENGCYAAADAAYDWLEREQGFAPEQIFIYGESLGGGVAVDLASRRPCGGMLLVHTFADLPSVAQRIYPWLPVVALMRNRFDSFSKIGRIRAPVVVAHAGDDELISRSDFDRLFGAITAPKASLIRFGKTHEDPLEPSELRQMRDFLVHCGRLPKP
jgi:pimeloyl-ACP methyl ester carboxylesterase